MNNKEPVNSDFYNRDYYLNSNEGGKIFQDSKGRSVSFRFRYFEKLAKLNPGQKVLDVGCGRGEVIIQCGIMGSEGLGIDYSKEGIKFCNEIKNTFDKSIQERIKFEQRDIKSMNLAINYYDRVFMLDVIEHLHDWELEISLKSILDAMKKKGILIVHTTPNTDFYKYGYPLIRLMYPILRTIAPPIERLINTKPNWKGRRTLPKDPEEGQEGRGGHVNEMNPKRLKRTLEKAGFQVKIILVPFTRDLKSPFLKLVKMILSLPIIRMAMCAEIIAICTKE